MIDRIIEFSLKNRFIIITAYVLVAGWGYWALIRTPVDAIPDLSDNQVIVFSDWTGRSPQEVRLPIHSLQRCRDCPVCERCAGSRPSGSR